MYELASVGLPGRNRVLAADGEVDRVERDRVAPVVGRLRGRRAAVEQALVVRRVVLLVEAGRESKVGQLDVPVLVDQDVVRLDVAVRPLRVSSRFKC